MNTNQQTLSARASQTTDQTSGIEQLIENPPPELAPYWPKRIIEDTLNYQKYTTTGTRFYDTCQDHIYEITERSRLGTVLTLSPCQKESINGEQLNSQTKGQNYVDNICALAGAIETGELVHIPSGTFRQIQDICLTHIDTETLEFSGITALNANRRSFTPPNSSTVTDVIEFANNHSIEPNDIAVYTSPETNTSIDTGSQSINHSSYQSAEQDVKTRFIPVTPFSRWTFEDETIRSWVESHIDTGDRVLNSCCGKTKLTPPKNGSIIRNDINPDRDADIHVDVAELAAVDRLEENSLDVIIFDPPWSLYQANLRYQNNHVHQVSNSNTHNIDLSTLPFDTPEPAEKTQIGHAAIAKRGFDYLLKPGGIVIELTLHGTSMPQSLSYSRQERVIFDPVGEARAVIGSVDQKTRQQLSEFF